MTRPTLALLAALLLCASCGPVDALRRRLEAGDDGVLFSHRLHLARGVGCDDCHRLDGEGARYAIPDHSTCSACHQIPEPATDLSGPWLGGERAGCRGCHPSPAPPAPRAARAPARYDIGPVQFSHAVHGGERCAACHGDLSVGEPRFAESLPTMGTCVSCHVQAGAPTGCESCHPALPAPWSQPEARASLPFPHPAGWEQIHGSSAQMQAETCALCHQPSACQSCHQAVPPRDHRSAGWSTSMHGKAALFERERCASCHVETSCQRCHQVAPTTHTAGFVDPLAATVGDPGVRLHSLLGKSQLRACLSCHATSDCTPCHSAGSLP